MPYDLENNKGKQMIKPRTTAAIEMLWLDPMNKSMNVISYWVGLGPGKIRCKVINNTLGFGNKIGPK